MNNMRPSHGTARAQDSQHLGLGTFGRLFGLPSDEAENEAANETTSPSDEAAGTPPTLNSWAVDSGVENQEVPEIMARLGGQDGIMHDPNNGSRDSNIPAAYTLPQNIPCGMWVMSFKAFGFTHRRTALRRL